MNRSKLAIVLVFVVLFSSFPAALAGMDPDYSTSGSIRVYKQSRNIRIKVSRSAPYIFNGGRPTRSFKWTLYKRDVYGRYMIHSSGYSSLGSWRLNVWGVKVYAYKNLYRSNVNPGSYRVKVWFGENCYYRSLRISKSFSMG